ncbi:hypothetical protein ACGE0T_14340 [Parabacteroides sp. APC149_11_2_Y6]
MAATLTEAILNDLMMGVSSIRMVDQTDSLTDTTFDDADQIFTTEGSLNIAQGDPTKTEIKIDQSDLAIETAYTAGEFPITGTVPSSAIELFDYFFNKSKTQPTLTTGITSIDGTTKYKSASGYSLDNKRKRVTMLIESQSKKTAVVFMNVDMVVSINWGEVKTTPLGLNFSGTVLRNSTDGKSDFIILKAESASSSSLL